eukprot:2353918-Amphidinium_carterae.1
MCAWRRSLSAKTACWCGGSGSPHLAAACGIAVARVSLSACLRRACRRVSCCARFLAVGCGVSLVVRVTWAAASLYGQCPYVVWRWVSVLVLSSLRAVAVAVGGCPCRLSPHTQAVLPVPSHCIPVVALLC